MNQPAYYFSVTNRGGPCTVNGYPTIRLVDSDGDTVHDKMGQGGGYVTEDPGPRDITLAPQAKAWFAVSTLTMCSGDPPEAPSSTGLSVALPGEATATTVAVGIEYCPEAFVSVSALAEYRELRS
jgi:hypothetical protein